MVYRRHRSRLAPINPNILGDVWKSSALPLCNWFPEWLIVHLVVLNTLRPMLEG